MVDRLIRLADRALGSGPVTALPRRASRRQLRVLAYHGVERDSFFPRHMRHIRERYHPVDAAAVVDALHGGDPLPDAAVWVTFDDGEPSVIENALPVTTEYQIPATVFICPGVVDSHQPLWWDTVAAALDLGETVRLGERQYRATELGSLKRRLKTLDDTRRREIVAGLAASIVDRNGAPFQRRQVTSTELRLLIDSGWQIGNHTWDHPCLDRCEPSVQLDQVESAHEWMRANIGVPPVLFAYPNGNHSERAEAALVDLGYQIGVLFDHHLATVTSDPLRISRLRVNDTTTPERFAAIVSGVHPALHSARSRLSPAEQAEE